MIFILSKADPFSYSVWRLLPSEEAPPFLNRENGIQTLHPFDRRTYFLVASGAAGAGAGAVPAGAAGAGASAGFSALGSGLGASFLLQPIPTTVRLMIIAMAMKRKTHFLMLIHLLSE